MKQVTDFAGNRKANAHYVKPLRQGWSIWLPAWKYVNVFCEYIYR